MVGDPTHAEDVVRTYVDATAARLTADGCTVQTEDWFGWPVLIGYRSDFRLRWMATKLHLFTVVAATNVVSVDAIAGFTDTAVDYALARKGQLRGVQSGVAVLSCLVGRYAHAPAVAWARERQRTRFACMVRPVVVEAATGAVSCFRDTSLFGWVYSGYLRRKLDAYFPSVTTAPPGATNRQ
ncbi:MAG TPA: levansucrase [Micromonosporaceae bacterium]